MPSDHQPAVALPPHVRHVVWDWNGTLLDDLDLVVDAVNAVLARSEVPPIDVATYTATYTRPVRGFYERLHGRPLADAEWRSVDDVWHAAYRAGVLERARLARHADRALDLVSAAGASQSLLSMYRHEQLVPLLHAFDVHDRFVHVQGLTGPGGGHKQPHLATHLDAVAHHTGGDPARVLVVGDALDDAAAAAAAGARCVLVASGSHPRAELEAAGVPVVDSLPAALAVA